MATFKPMTTAIPVVDGSPTVNNFDDADSVDGSVTFSHTVNARSNSILVVTVGLTDNVPVTAVTYNGDALTEIDYVGASSPAVAMWYMVNPDTGTHTVDVSMSETFGTIAATNFYNVDQNSPVGTPASDEASTGTASVTVDSSIGDLVIDGGHFWANPTADSSQAPLFEDVSNGERTAGSSKEGETTSTAMSWTFSADRWRLIGVALHGAGAGGGGGAEGPARIIRLRGNIKILGGTRLR
jgi:hypothetical protein